MPRKAAKTVRLDPEDVKALERAEADGVSSSESSTTISRLPRMTSLSGLSLSRMPSCRMVCDGAMKVRPT